MNELVIRKRLIFSSYTDHDDEVEISINNHYDALWSFSIINREEALQIIEHLKKAFEL